MVFTFTTVKFSTCVYWEPAWSAITTVVAIFSCAFFNQFSWSFCVSFSSLASASSSVASSQKLQLRNFQEIFICVRSFYFTRFFAGNFCSKCQSWPFSIVFINFGLSVQHQDRIRSSALLPRWKDCIQSIVVKSFFTANFGHRHEAVVALRYRKPGAFKFLTLLNAWSKLVGFILTDSE